MKQANEAGQDNFETRFYNQEKKKKMKKTITRSAVLLVLVSAVAFFWSDIRDVVASSSGEKNKKQETVDPPSAAINIQKKWELPEDLREISGLSYLDGERFACIQDETGVVYVYNTATSAVEKEIRFAGAGDFEGLAMVGNTAWIVRSDGHLYEVNISEGRPATKEYDTHLTADYNIEGLCYDAKNNRLLLAPKDGEPGNSDYKGIYAFDLATKKLAKEPVMKLNMTDERLLAGAKKKKKGPFMPSAITIHPGTGDYYITDGRNSKLLVMNENGEISTLYQLDKNEFAQPEGIAFTPEGELFISNEGPKEPGNILKVEITK